MDYRLFSNLINLNPSIKIFNIGCNDLSDKSAPYISEILSFETIESLQLGVGEKALHPNRFSSVTLDVIAESLSTRDKLFSLGLNSSSFSVKPGANAPSPSMAISKILASCKKLKNLKLSSCDLASATALEIIESGLTFNSTLERLDISYNNLSPEVGISLAEYLLHYTKETTVTEDENSDPVYHVNVTKRIPHIFYLDVSFNSFGINAAKAFERVLGFNPYLGFLDLSGNAISDDGAILLANRLRDNSSLVELRLSSNGITHVGGSAILKALMLNLTLTNLDLSKNKLGDEFSSVLADFLKVNPTITHLKLCSASITNAGGILVVQATCFCPTLISLDMSDNFFTETAGPDMEKFLTLNKILLRLDVTGTQINHFSLSALESVLSEKFQHA